MKYFLFRNKMNDSQEEKHIATAGVERETGSRLINQKENTSSLPVRTTPIESGDSFQRGSSIELLTGGKDASHNIINFSQGGSSKNQNVPTDFLPLNQDNSSTVFLKPLHSESSSSSGQTRGQLRLRQAKATSLVRRKTSDLEEDDLQYTESNANAGTHYFQLETHNERGAHQPNGAGSSFSSKFQKRGSGPSQSKDLIPQDVSGCIQSQLQEANFEVTQLLSKLNPAQTSQPQPFQAKTEEVENPFRKQNTTSISSGRPFVINDCQNNDIKEAKKGSESSLRSNPFQSDRKNISPGRILSKSQSGLKHQSSEKTNQFGDFINNQKSHQDQASQNHSQYRDKTGTTQNENISGKLHLNQLNTESEPETANVQEHAIQQLHQPIQISQHTSSLSAHSLSQPPALHPTHSIFDHHQPPSFRNQYEIVNLGQSDKVTFRVPDQAEPTPDSTFARAVTGEQNDLRQELGRLRVQKSEQSSEEGDERQPDTQLCKEPDHPNDEEEEHYQEGEFEQEEDEMESEDGNAKESSALLGNGIREDKAGFEEEEEIVNHQQSINEGQEKEINHFQSKSNLNYTDEVVYNRLPKNFFVKEAEEDLDLVHVMSSIKQMREDFQGYMKETKVKDRLDEISDILLQPPEKFIERHFKAMGLEGPQDEMMFEKVLEVSSRHSPSPSLGGDRFISNHVLSQTMNHQKGQGDRNHTSKKSLPLDAHSLTLRDTEPGGVVMIGNDNLPDMFSANLSGDDNNNNYATLMSHQSTKVRQSSGNAPRGVQFCEAIVNNPARLLQEAVDEKGNVTEIEERMRKTDFETFPKQSEGELTSIKNHRPNMRVIQPQEDKAQKVKSIKMADYFTITSTDNNPQATITSHQPHLHQFNSSLNPSHEQEVEEEDLPPQIREQLVERLENEIIGNLDINFLFNKGEKLRHSLIDQARLYRIMLKIKEVAQAQISSGGSKQIDYTAIVRFLEEEDQFIEKGAESEILRNFNNEQLRYPTAEPRKSKIPIADEVDESQWIHIVDFMRKNPKLMLQMLPDNSPEANNDLNLNPFMQPSTTQASQLAQVNKNSEEVKQLIKLKDLSLKFNHNRRQFLEAIDKFQEAQIQQIKSPKAAPSQKEVKVKSISSNQRKIKQAHASNKAMVNVTSDQILVSSDGESFLPYAPPPPQEQVERPLIFNKQFEYTSVKQAKSIYNNQPYPPPSPREIAREPDNENLRVNRYSSNSQTRKGAESKSPPPQSQEFQIQYKTTHSMLDQLATKTNFSGLRKQKASAAIMPGALSKLGNVKKCAPLESTGSNLDATTLAASMNGTGMKRYRNNIMAQIQTSSQEDIKERPQTGVASTASMFTTKFARQSENPTGSGMRRPITANAAMGGARFAKHSNNLGVFSSSNFGIPENCHLIQKSSAQFVRQPSASGMSSFTQQVDNNRQSSHAGGLDQVTIVSSQQCPKFVQEKCQTWKNPPSIQETALKSEALAKKVRPSNHLVQKVQSNERNLQGANLSGAVKYLERRRKTQQSNKNDIGAESSILSIERSLVNTSPKPKTQEYIQKIAPNLKEQPIYPKFVTSKAKKLLGISGERDASSRGGIDSGLSSAVNLSVIQSGSKGKELQPTKLVGLKNHLEKRSARYNTGGDQSIKSSTRMSFQEQATLQRGNGFQKFIKAPKNYTHVQFSQQPSENANLTSQRVGSTHSDARRSIDSQPRVGSSHSHNQRAASSHSQNRVNSTGSLGRLRSSQEGRGAMKRDKSFVDSNGQLSSEVIRDEGQFMIEQNLQTKIGGVRNRVLVSPNQGDKHGGYPEGCKFESQYDSQDEQEELMREKRRAHLSSKGTTILPLVDWAFTPLFYAKALTSGPTEDALAFNPDGSDPTLYEEKEVDYVIDMMKHKYKDFKRSDIMRPFYLKAQLTLKALTTEQGQEAHFERLMHKYREITIENTMKLLIRAKLMFHSRVLLYGILKHVLLYEVKAVSFKELVGRFRYHKVESEEYDSIQDAGTAAIEAGYELLLKIKNLRQTHKQFRAVPFIFKKKDQVNYVKSEMNELRRVMFAFRVRTDTDLLEEKKLKEQEEKDKKDLEERVKFEIHRAKKKGEALSQEALEEKLKYEQSSETDEEELRRQALISPLRYTPPPPLF